MGITLDEDLVIKQQNFRRFKWKIARLYIYIYIYIYIWDVLYIFFFHVLLLSFYFKNYYWICVARIKEPHKFYGSNGAILQNGRMRYRRIKK